MPTTAASVTLGIIGHTHDYAAMPLNLGHGADEEILSLLTSGTCQLTPRSDERPHQGPREQSAGSRPIEQAQHASHLNHGSQLAFQHDNGVHTGPNQAAPKKRPVPHSFKPVKKLAFVPPRGRHADSQPSHHALRPSPPVSAQPASSGLPWPLSLRSTNQQQSASRDHVGKEPPQGNRGRDQWLGTSPGSAQRHQGKQKRQPVLASQPGTGTSSGTAPGRAADELYFSAAGVQPPVRLCTVPDAIGGGAADYASVWLLAVYEELNLQ